MSAKPAQHHAPIDFDERLRFYLSFLGRVVEGPACASWRQAAHMLVDGDLVDRMEATQFAAMIEADARRDTTIAARGFQLPPAVGDVAGRSAIDTAAGLIGRACEIGLDLARVIAGCRAFDYHADCGRIAASFDIGESVAAWRNRVRFEREWLDLVNADLFRTSRPNFMSASPLARAIQLERDLVPAAATPAECDGLIPPDRLQVGGRVVELAPRLYRAVEAVWGRWRVTESEFADHVWGADHTTKAMMRGLCRDLNKAIAPIGGLVSRDHSGGVVTVSFDSIPASQK
jgi:hypothetical protein